ncbi:MAG: oligosaccharide flippase family protein [Patescibacteria group bacterium]|nr:oligosaccharide flippase family protein [Patescibacteria group bacterium]
MKRELQGDFRDIIRRIKKKDFRGYAGMAVKNSIYQLSTNSIAKIGSLFFTIIIARLLLPELFGLYSLALSTILIFVAFSELGVGDALVRFVSKALGKNREIKAKSYTRYLVRIRIFAIIFFGLILILSARFISDTYYQKPLFLALIAGSLYVLFVGVMSFIQSILQATNYFKGIFYKEIIFQVARIIIIPLIVLFLLKQDASQEIHLFFIILGLALVYLITSLFLLVFSKIKINYLKKESRKISRKEKNKLNKFILAISATALSGIFFSYIDMIMLGGFVFAGFLGYYKVSLSLVSALGPLISFSFVLLPIFSRMTGKKLENAFKKSFRITLLISLAALLFILIFSSPLIRIIYGTEYLPSINILRILSLLLISSPLISLYTIYFVAKGKPLVVTKILIISTIINIILNYIMIKSLIGYGDIFAVFGVAISTIVSRYFFLGGLIFSKKSF